ncbi:MAG: N-acetylmuramoyl-L-alanine amidase [Planctomycetes bacterium]|nr:N-acetylmuramoyl-L-alanine amidase [Planctomycetota bacterium]
MTRRFARYFSCLVALCVFVASCGGGGGGSSAPASSTALANISGLVQDESGSVVKDFSVMLFGTNTDELNSAPIARYDFSDENGEFEITDLPVGSYKIVTVPVSQTLAVSETINVSAPASGVVAKVTQGVSLTGRVVTDTDTPIAGAEITLDDPWMVGGWGIERAPVVTDASGNFTVDRLRAGYLAHLIVSDTINGVTRFERAVDSDDPNKNVELVIDTGQATPTYAHFPPELNTVYNLGAGEMLDLTLTPDDSATDWDLQLVGPDGKVVAGSYEGAGTNETISVSADAAGNYRIFTPWIAGSGQFSVTRSTNTQGSGLTQASNAAGPGTLKNGTLWPTGTNPTPAQLWTHMQQLGTQYNVPPEIIACVASQESDCKQWDSNGDFVYNKTEWRNKNVTPPGLGMMQLTGSTATAFDTDRLVTDVWYNIEAGVRVLVDKWNLCEKSLKVFATPNPDRMVLENWWHPIHAYNGWVSSNQTIPDLYFKRLKNLPYPLDQMLSGPITVTYPSTVLPGWHWKMPYTADNLGRFIDSGGTTYPAPTNVSVLAANAPANNLPQSAATTTAAASATTTVSKPAMTWSAAYSGNYTNASRTASNIDTIVIHTIEGTASSAINWFKNSSAKVSSHYVVSKTGQITQMVDVADKAWTQTYYNGRAIGIECEGYASQNGWTPQLMSALEQLTAWLCQTYTVSAVHPSGQAASSSSPYNKGGLVGHYQITPWNKTDPGSYFPWTSFVTNVNAILGGGSSGGGTTPPANPPAAPTGLSPSGNTENGPSVTLNWSSLFTSGVTSYEVEIEYGASTSTFAPYHVYLATTNQQTFWPYVDNNYYRYRARGKNSGGWGPNSAWASFYYTTTPSTTPAPTPLVPPAPMSLTPTGGTTETNADVTLGWSDLSSSGATVYELTIEYSSDNATWKPYVVYTETTNSKKYWPQVDPAYYRFQVRGQNSVGWGALSAWSDFYFNTTPATPTPSLPAAPTGILPLDGSVEAGPSLTYSWNDMSSSGVTGYELVIEYGPDANSWSPYYTYSLTTNSKLFYPQVADSNYRFSVRAQNSAGWGPYSAWSGYYFGTQSTSPPTTTPPTTGGGAPTQPTMTWKAAASGNFSTANRTSASIDTIVIHTTEGPAGSAVNWFQNSAAKVSSHYVVAADGSITQMVKIKDVAYTQTYYNARAIGIECDGYASQSGTWTPQLVASLEQLVAWLCVTYNVSAVHPSGDANQSGGTYTKTGVVAHSQIQPWNKSDPGSYFPWTSFMTNVGAIISGGGGATTPPTTVNAPTAPSGLSPASGTESGASVTLAWADQSSENVTSYEVVIEYGSDGANYSSYVTYTETATSKVFWPVVDPAHFRFKVRAQNSGGWSSYSAYANFLYATSTTAPPAPTLTVPTNLAPDGTTTTETGPSVVMMWSSLGGSGASSYDVKIEYGSDGVTYSAYHTYTSVTTNQKEFWPQVDNNYYRFSVLANYSSGASAYSTPAVFYFSTSGASAGGGTTTPPTSSNVPTNLGPTSTQTNDSVMLTWDTVSGATSYEVEIEYGANNSTWSYYYTYTPSVNSKTFYPQVNNNYYRFRVRAMVGGTWSSYSGWTSFSYNGP